MAEPIKITNEQALALSIRPEDEFFDRKGSACSGKKAQKAGVSFANAEGGELVVGIKDEKEECDPTRRLDPFSTPEDANGVLQALFEINPALVFRYEFNEVDSGGFVLRVFFDKTQHVHATADGTVYKRVGASSLPLRNPAEITQMAFGKGAISYENVKIESGKAEDIVDTGEIESLVSGIPERPDSLAFAVNEGLIDRDDYKPVVAGALLFADHPQGLVPTRCECRIVFYDTRDEIPERAHLKINETISGPLYRQIHSVVNRVSEILSNISILTPGGLTKVHYPHEAIWEIVTNAIIHRDYSIADDIQIIIYQDRVEVISPGALPAFVNLDNILDVRYSRNPKIVRSLRRYADPPNQDLGEGLNTAFQKMEEQRLKPPKIRIDKNRVIVTIEHKPLATPEEAVIEYLKASDRITNRQARLLTGIKSENQMKEVLYRLRDRGIIQRDPALKGNKSAWVRT